MESNPDRLSAKLPNREKDEPVRLHPAWRAFIQYCRDMRHGEIERLSIQDGMPVLAEVTKRKVKFTQ